MTAGSDQAIEGDLFAASASPFWVFMTEILLEIDKPILKKIKEILHLSCEYGPALTCHLVEVDPGGFKVQVGTAKDVMQSAQMDLDSILIFQTVAEKIIPLYLKYQWNFFEFSSLQKSDECFWIQAMELPDEKLGILCLRVPQKTTANPKILFSLLTKAIHHLLLNQSQQQTIGQLNKQLERLGQYSELGSLMTQIQSEIQPPLRNVVTDLEGILNSYRQPQGFAENTIEKLTEVVLATEKVRNLNEELSRFARTDHFETRLERYDLPELIESLLVLSQVRAKHEGCKIEFTAQNITSPVYCDALKVTQSLLHLLQISMDLTAPSEQKWVKVTAFETATEFRISISNNGPEVSIDQRHQMMRFPFTLKITQKGLGLNLAKRYIDLHQGQLHFDPTQPKTTFVVTLPKRPEPEVQNGKLGVVKKRPVVILVEDEDDLREMVAEEFLQRGFLVRTTDNGQEALEMMKYNPADVLISDDRVPHLTGSELLASLLGKNYAPPLRVLVTGFNEPTGSPESLGVHSVWKKPFPIAELCDAVRQGLGRG